jgi:stage III sporulation protein AE
MGPLDDAERLLGELERAAGGELPRIGWREVVEMVRGGGRGPDWRALGSSLTSYFMREVVANAGLLGRMLALLLLIGLLGASRSSFGDESVARVAYFAACAVLASFALTGLRTAVDAARQHVALTADFMRALLPMLLGLLVTIGAVVTAGLFSPWFVLATYSLVVLVNDWVMPLAMLAAACELISALGGQVKITSLAASLRQAAVVVLGLALTAFLGVMTVQRAAGTVADGVAFRTGKFLASSFLPVIGKLFGDAMEVVVGGALVTKAAVGLAGAVAVLAVTALPALRIAALLLIYRIAAVLAQPIAGGPAAGLLDGVANSLMVVLLAVSGAGLACFVTLVMILGAGNAAVMLR